MTASKKRLRIRDPLTQDEVANGQTYYSEADINRILGQFALRPDIDRAEFARQLEVAAWWFVNLAASNRGKPPSTLQRKWQREARRLEELIAKFDQRDGREQAALEYAAEDLARRRGKLPDLAPEIIEVPPIPGAGPSPSDSLTVWPIEEQLRKSQAAIEWYYECITEAATQAASEKSKPGNRPIEAKHNFYRAVARIYEEAALNPQNPQKDRVEEVFCGEVFDFFEACLRPLGVQDTRRTIYDTYYNAGAKLPKKSPSPIA